MAKVAAVIGMVATIVGIAVALAKLRWDREDRRRQEADRLGEQAEAASRRLPVYDLIQMEREALEYEERRRQAGRRARERQQADEPVEDGPPPDEPKEDGPLLDPY